MIWLENLFFYLFPNLLVKDTPWHREWANQERREFVFTARIFFAIAAPIYLAHYFFLDVPLDLQPPELWRTYRFSMAGLALVCLGFYCWSWMYQRRFFKAPALLACWVFCYFQAQTILWYSEVPYLYSFIFVLISMYIIRSSVLNSIALSGVFIASMWPAFMQAGLDMTMVSSAAVVTLTFTVFLRSKHLSEVKYFIANNQRIEAQKKAIEINLEFTDQIRSFLPKEISHRLDNNIKHEKMTVVQAIDNVLQPRKLNIACLFSDIRGFTQGTKNLEEFIGNGVMPNVKACTEAVEHCSGIPRKIGDLIFAYFDDTSESVNLLNAIMAGMEVARINYRFNRSGQQFPMIFRHILIATGPAIVGNLGGYNSSVEITALGSPVNFLSRLDDATKHPQLKELLGEMDLIISAEAAETINAMQLNLQMKHVSLKDLGVEIRDFPEVEDIWLLPVSDGNYNAVIQFFKYLEQYEKSKSEAVA